MEALIVDDEKRNRDSLRKLLTEHCPNIQIIGEASSVDETLCLLKKSKPGLIFLDVEMPNGSGFDLLQRVDKFNFKVIFVTAHSHYAIKALRLSAIDYLLKPVDTDDLSAAVKKACEDNSDVRSHYKGFVENLSANGVKKLAVPIKDGFAFLAPDEIVRLQADGTYTHIYTQKEKYTGTKNIKEYEQLLSDQNFYRSHNSHLINLKHVKKFSRLDGYFVQMSDDSMAEISRRKKEEFIERMVRH